MTAAAPADVAGCARRGRPRDERLDADIARAAVDELADVGFDRFAVESVAARAGVAKTTVYRRFPTRADLIAAALDQLAEEPTPSVDGSARDQILAIATAIRAGMPDSPRGRILMHAVGSDDPHLAQLVYTKVLSARSGVLRGAIARGMESGEFRDDLDVDAAVALVVGPMLYLAMWRNRDSLQGLTVDDIIDLAMKGLTPASGS